MASRRHHHEGSVYQRADGRWVASVRVGTRPDGKAERRSVYAATEEEATRKLADLLLKVDPVRDLTSSATVGLYLKRWLAHGIRPRVSAGSHRFLNHLVRRHLEPHLGNLKLSELDAEKVQGFYLKLQASGASTKTLFHSHMCLKWALTHAVRWGLLQQNPCSMVPRPRNPHISVSVLTPEQVRRFLEAAHSDRYYPLYVLALTCGLRKGELFALRTSDLDLNRRRLHVRRSMDLHTYTDSMAKSRTSERIIALPKFTAKALAAHLEHMQAEGYDGEYIFVTPNHRPLRDNAFTSNSFRPILAEAEIERLKFHQLRHTCAAILLSMDVPIRQVSATLGHARPQFTLDVYGHLIPGMEESAVERLEEIFKGF